MRPSRDFTMEQHLIQQWLARIGYASSPDHQSLEPHPDARSGLQPATAERLLLKVLDQSKEQYAAQQQQVPAANFLSRPAAHSCGPESCTEQSFLSDTSSTTPLLGTEANYTVLEPRHGHEFRPSHCIPLRPKGGDTSTRHHSELERRQETCLKIEREIEICQQEIRAHPSKQNKINEEHERRIAELVKPPHDEKQNAEIRNQPKTAEEAEFEEMREIYLQYDHGSIGVPNAETVDAFFAVIADTEGHIKSAEEANKAARMREAKLQGKLYEARCAMDAELVAGGGRSGGDAGQGAVSGGSWE